MIRKNFLVAGIAAVAINEVAANRLTTTSSADSSKPLLSIEWPRFDLYNTQQEANDWKLQSSSFTPLIPRGSGLVECNGNFEVGHFDSMYYW